jgi:hypothetical protein
MEPIMEKPGEEEQDDGHHGEDEPELSARE